MARNIVAVVEHDILLTRALRSSNVVEAKLVWLALQNGRAALAINAPAALRCIQHCQLACKIDPYRRPIFTPLMLSRPKLRDLRGLGFALCAVFEATAFVAGLDDLAMVGVPVEEPVEIFASPKTLGQSQQQDRGEPPAYRGHKLCRRVALELLA